MADIDSVQIQVEEKDAEGMTVFMENLNYWGMFVPN